MEQDITLADIERLSKAHADARLRLKHCPKDADKAHVWKLICEAKQAADAEYQAALLILGKTGAE